MSSALGLVQNPTNVSQPLSAKEPSGSNWVYRARIASQVALPVIMNTAFVLSMVGSIIFPPATVFLLIGIGVTAGLLWHLIPDPYVGLQGNSSQVDTPPDRPVPKNRDDLRSQQKKDETSLKESQTRRREEVLGAYTDGDDKDSVNEILGELEQHENCEQKLEQEIERRGMYHREAFEQMAVKHKDEQRQLSEMGKTFDEEEDLYISHEEDLKKLEQGLERTVEPKRAELAQIKKQKEMNQAILSYELGRKDLGNRQIERRKKLEELRAQKDPSGKYTQALGVALDGLEGCETNELQTKFALKRGELQGADQDDIKNKRLAVDEAEKNLSTAQKALADSISEIDPGLSAQIGTAFQAMGSMMGSAIQTARGSSGVLFGAPGRVRDLLPSSSVMTSRLAPVGRWIGGVPSRIRGSLPSFHEARNPVASRSYGIEDSVDNLLNESSQMRRGSSSSLVIEMNPFDSLNDEEAEDVVVTSLPGSSTPPNSSEDAPREWWFTEGIRNLGSIFFGPSREHNVQRRIMDEENL